MEKLAEGDWDDAIEEQLGDAIAEAIDDFGPDFDEEGNPLEEGESDRIMSEEEREKEGRTAVGRGRRRRRGLARTRSEEAGERPPRTASPTRPTDDQANPWPPRRTSRTASLRSRTSRRSRAPWRWWPRRGCAAPSSASRHLRPYARGDPADDPAHRRGRGERSPACRCSRRTRRRSKVGILLVTGDRGLAGAFNSQIIRAGNRRARELRGRGQGGRLVRLGAPRACPRSRSAGETWRAPGRASPTAPLSRTPATSPGTSPPSTSTARSTGSR